MTARPSVLLVDDDASVRRALVRLLHDVACVTDVDSAEAALVAIGTGTVFDAIVSDMSMQGMSGIDLFDVLRAKHPELASRFIAISGAYSHLENEAFRNAIGDRVLLKPLDREELLQLVLAVAGSADIAAE